MKIQHTNFRLVPFVDTYPEELWMLVQTLDKYVLSFDLSASFVITMEWFSLASLTAVFSKTTKVATFKIIN